MLTAGDIEERRELIAAAPDLQALQTRLVERAGPVLRQRPVLPGVKALLSTDGGVCPEDGSPLRFDPWQPSEHRCPRCGRGWRGDRHDRWWARFQHLWLSERIAHLGTVAVLADHQPAAEQARSLLGAYADLYPSLPNRDNVLGPSRLFFSTYLESIWILNYLAGATLLREAGQLSSEDAARVDTVADLAAGVIGDFNEGYSNRQTWNAAALTAIGAWFGDEELARTAIEERTGLIGHLAEGYGEDGMWYEGENYHLFALRGMLTGLSWARYVGAEVLEDPELAAMLLAALRAPIRTALPDFTFPARKDARFGVSLAQPMYEEEWEIGRAWLQAEGDPLGQWLADLYAAPAPAAPPFDSYLHEVGEPAPAHRGRQDLSWWSLLEMDPALDARPGERPPEDSILTSHGLSVLRRPDRYLSLECGTVGGGHGHADRLHLTCWAAGMLWLPDPGAGSYVSRDLFWYRSTLAHNAPRAGGHSQPLERARPQMFDHHGDWQWIRGSFTGFTRTVVDGPDYALDLLEFADQDEQLVELPWHLQGQVTLEGGGEWVPDRLENDFVSEVARLRHHAGTVTLHAEHEEAHCHLHLLFEGDLLRAQGPGLPNGEGRQTFYLVRHRGRVARCLALLEFGAEPQVRALRSMGEQIEVDHAGGTDRHSLLLEAWEIDGPGGSARLTGRIPPPPEVEAVVTAVRRLPVEAVAPWIDAAPALDGTGAGFDRSEPLLCDTEDQYRRSEEPWPGPELLRAEAAVNWNEQGLYVLADVTTPEVVLRPPEAPPLLLDNDPDDIHSDGLQVYLRRGERVDGFLIVPEEGGRLRVHRAGGTSGEPSAVRGAWSRTEDGYRVTLAIEPPDWDLHHGGEIGFDLLVNVITPGRVRRSGQLVWSGGNGWVYLIGDRQDPDRFGTLSLV